MFFFGIHPRPNVNRWCQVMQVGHAECTHAKAYSCAIMFVLYVYICNYVYMVVVLKVLVLSVVFYDFWYVKMTFGES